jgi:hypothetical protein
MKKLLFILVFILFLTACTSPINKGQLFEKSQVRIKYEKCTQPFCFASPCPMDCTKFYICEDGRYIWNTRLYGILNNDLIEKVENSDNQVGLLGSIGVRFETKAKEESKSDWYYQYDEDFDPCGKLRLPEDMELFTMTLDEYNNYDK